MSTATDRDTAVVAYREDGRWQVGLLPETLAGDLEGLLAALRQQPAESGALALVDVAHEFFVALRVGHGEPRVLLSDVTAAVAWDLAVQVCELLDVPIPDDEEDVAEVLPTGDLSIFADLGLDEMELGAVLADTDAYADEMLAVVAQRLGFADAYERVVADASR